MAGDLASKGTSHNIRLVLVQISSSTRRIPQEQCILFLKGSCDIARFHIYLCCSSHWWSDSPWASHWILSRFLSIVSTMTSQCGTTAVEMSPWYFAEHTWQQFAEESTRIHQQIRLLLITLIIQLICAYWTYLVRELCPKHKIRIRRIRIRQA